MYDETLCRSEQGKKLPPAGSARLAESIEYELCWKGVAGKVETVSFAILAEYLGDEEQARKACAGFARLMGARFMPISGLSEKVKSPRRWRQ